MRGKNWVSGVSLAVMLMGQSAAWGAGLGKLSLNSALGQPLSADINILLADPAEFNNLSARLASSDAFHRASVEMNSTLESIHFALEKKPDGTAVLHLSSSKPVEDPFLDMIIELDWSNGQMLREYTVLLDPPGAGIPGEQTTPKLVVNPATSAAVPASAPGAQPSPAVQPQAASQRPPAAGAPAVKTIRVERGATLISIASQVRPEGVHLEQMLVGLYRSNPQAFDGNMNRLKAGQVLHVPGKDVLTSISETGALREIHLQAEDWHAYRQKLAGEVEQAPQRSASANESSGKIAPAVQDRSAQAAPAGQGVLKLSRGAAPSGKGGVSGDEMAAQQKALQDADSRLAALEKNIQDMQTLLAMKDQQLAQAEKQSRTAAPAAPVPAPATAPATQAPKPVTEVKPPVAPEIHPKPKPVHHVPFKPVQAPPAPAWYQMLDPRYLGAAGGVLLLGGALWWMARNRRRRDNLSRFENSILTSVDSKPNTVYNTQGGESVNTSSNTSFLTDFSQSGLGTLDTHDVDPIAEAEVYMAYGRDVQAEEILREAMTKEPNRLEIRLKLLEIYAGRSNLPAFESGATELYSMLGGQPSPLWDRAAEMGRKLDPHNPLYGGQASEVAVESPVAAAAVAAVAAEAFDHETAHAAVTEPESEPEQTTAEAPMEFVAQAPEAASATAVEETPAETGAEFPGALDFDLEIEPEHPHETVVEASDMEPADAGPAHADEDEPQLTWDFVAPSAEKAQADETGLAGEHLSAEYEPAEAHDAVAVEEAGEEASPTFAPEFSGVEAGFTSAAPVPSEAHDAHAVPEIEAVSGMEAAYEPESAIATTAESEMEAVPETGAAHGEDAESAALEMGEHAEEPLMLDFSGINLDFGDEAAAPAEVAPQAGDDATSAVAETGQGVDVTGHPEGTALSEAEQEVGTKFELAQVYQEMGDIENAREILQEVIAEGNERQRSDAEALLQQMDNASS